VREIQVLPQPRFLALFRVALEVTVETGAALVLAVPVVAGAIHLVFAARARAVLAARVGAKAVAPEGAVLTVMGASVEVAALAVEAPEAPALTVLRVAVLVAAAAEPVVRRAPPVAPEVLERQLTPPLSMP
jgi:hypothetical protein